LTTEGRRGEMAKAGLEGRDVRQRSSGRLEMMGVVKDEGEGRPIEVELSMRKRVS
jgi:hypothetical protein